MVLMSAGVRLGTDIVPSGGKDRTGELLLLAAPRIMGMGESAKVEFAVSSGVERRVRVVVVWLEWTSMGQPCQ